MKSSIQIVEKPDWVSWDDIHELLWKAHEGNRKAGMFMKYPSLSGDEISELLGSKGRCFVALDGGKVVGTCSYKVAKRNTWYAKGQKVAHCVLAGLLPEYRGSGIYQRLLDYRESFVRKDGINIMDMDTAERNISVQKAFIRNNFHYVYFNSFPYGNHYSVYMAKWLDGCPYSLLYCKCRYYFAKLKTKVRFKPGQIKRFGI